MSETFSRPHKKNDFFSKSLIFTLLTCEDLNSKNVWNLNSGRYGRSKGTHWPIPYFLKVRAHVCVNGSEIRVVLPPIDRFFWISVITRYNVRISKVYKEKAIFICRFHHRRQVSTESQMSNNVFCKVPSIRMAGGHLSTTRTEKSPYKRFPVHYCKNIPFMEKIVLLN